MRNDGFHSYARHFAFSFPCIGVAFIGARWFQEPENGFPFYLLAGWAILYGVVWGALTLVDRHRLRRTRRGR